MSFICGIAAASNSSVRGRFEKSIGEAVLPLRLVNPGSPPKYSLLARIASWNNSPPESGFLDMVRLSLWMGLVIGMASGIAGVADQLPEQRQAVLVELFTSEGCSSCPPADALLERLDRSQPFQPIQVLALSEHVDYWNHLGWNDPYSSEAFSRRQEAYARQFGLSGVYTPQMVVDGSSEFVGNDAPQAQAAIAKAGKLPKLAV